MIPNTNDGGGKAPALRCYLNEGNAAMLPVFSKGPKADARAALAAIKAAGYDGVQGYSPAAAREFGLGAAGGGRIDKPADADGFAKRMRDEGWECATLHVGSGMESDDECETLIEAVNEASEKHRLPLYIETHRATITQDLFRTVQWTKRCPDIRFNGDFSHWYTGLEMVYGDIQKKLDFCAPVFDRVRFIHGRIGNPGMIQVDVGDGTNRTYVEHFKEMWTRSFAGFLRTAQAGDYFIFSPELLPAHIYYARTVKNAKGEDVEEGDRWEQALLYVKIAKACFEQARKLNAQRVSNRFPAAAAR